MDVPNFQFPDDYQTECIKTNLEDLFGEVDEKMIEVVKTLSQLENILNSRETSDLTTQTRERYQRKVKDAREQLDHLTAFLLVIEPQSALAPIDPSNLQGESYIAQYANTFSQFLEKETDQDFGTRNRNLKCVLLRKINEYLVSLERQLNEDISNLYRAVASKSASGSTQGQFRKERAGQIWSNGGEIDSGDDEDEEQDEEQDEEEEEEEVNSALKPQSMPVQKEAVLFAGTADSFPFKTSRSLLRVSI